MQTSRPRVAFIVHAYPKISEAFILYAALGLIRKGYAVDVIPMHGDEDPQAERHPVQDELEHVLRVIRPGEPMGGAGAARGALRGLLARHGMSALKAVDPTRFARDTFTLRPLMLADALNRGGPYDVVHCQFGTLGAPVIALRRAGLIAARIVVHFRGNDISRFVESRGESAYGETFAEADWFVANCQHFRNRAVALGCDPARIDVVPSGCDVARFPFVARRPPASGPVRLLAVGRLVEKKGHGLAIAALRRLRDGGLDVRLRIVGGGPLREELEAAAAQAEISDRVEFAGEQRHDAIADELARAHIFLAPSVRGSDGDEDAPVNTLKEAMATGTPVVASRHGGIPELVEHGVNGLLCAEGDADDLAEKIGMMIGAPALWPSFGAAGRSTVVEKFSLEVATEKLLHVYERALVQPEHQ